MRATRDTYLDVLETICQNVVAPGAAHVDAEADFPRGAVAALGEAGLLGAVSAEEVSGLGLGPRAAAAIVGRLARDCGSTAMVVCMHYAGVAVLEAYGPQEVRRAAASGAHLSTLAFSEAGSRSHFWAPTGTARRDGGAIVLDGRKSWATSAHHATAYVWSSRPVEAPGLSTIWLVPAGTPGVRVTGTFDGLGLRGNDSAPIVAEGARIDPVMLGEDGKGFDVMMGAVLPVFNLMNAAASVGLMEAAVARTAAHAGATRYEHSDTALAELPTIRAYVARMQTKTSMARCLLEDAVSAVEAGRQDAMLRVLECKAAAGEAAAEVVDLAMRVCGGAAYRREVGVERIFRDARAAGVMAPTTDVLYDFIGRAVCGLPLF